MGVSVEYILAYSRARVIFRVQSLTLNLVPGAQGSPGNEKAD